MTDITNELYCKIDEMYSNKFVTEAIEEVEPSLEESEDFDEWIKNQNIDTWITHPYDLV